jgi:hemerythrin-like domain-containing protein
MGGAVRREKLIDDMSGYVERLRRHMSWEEGDLFKRIDQMLEENKPEVDVSQYDHSKDPVFELEIEAGFRRLMTSLQRQ